MAQICGKSSERFKFHDTRVGTVRDMALPKRLLDLTLK